MKQVKSNHSRANQIATSMGHVTDAMQRTSKKQVPQASRTTLQVNQAAKQSSNQAKQLMSQLGQNFSRDVGHIRSVAKEFERVDRALSSGFDLDLQRFGK
ncbi:TIGR04197 family type VII secretion effector [Listeria booriae]|uniref:TIGR04197 family type VII secretion effector n=1 Tax=Listeria booriae TaxID=1552123 RepID=UPI001626500B|nr:TIGR04197 family type VII secretion effector [Listeria booriae]MBC2259874.1 TIGR04197 family type VII secretion effector [Listeria booriae]